MLSHPLFAAATETARLHVSLWAWALLLGWFIGLILIDLLVLHREDHEPTLRSAIIQSLVWIGLAVALGGVIWAAYGSVAGGQYFSGYLIEKSLSVDNVFAWSVILTYFAVQKKYQFRVLYWGVFGALLMRAVFIFGGIALIDRFEPILIVFGAILLYSGGKLLFTPDAKEFDPGSNVALKWFQRIVPVTHRDHGNKFFTHENGRRVATMLLVALVAVEITDIIFAVDSVPAILAISRDPFIVFASNAAAILGLRSLYFVFEAIKDRFWLLNRALGILLMLVGVKMVLSPTTVFGRHWFGLEIPIIYSLLGIGVLVGGAIALSLLIPAPRKNADRTEDY